MIKTILRNAAIVLVAGSGLFLFLLNFPVAKPLHMPVFGVTFTPKQAESFGLDWRKTYTAILDDLSVRNVRLIAYWNAIEARKGEYDFSQLDEQMNELSRRGGYAILTIGRKVPRWPECHDPAWLSEKSSEDIEADLLVYLSAVVTHYKNHPALSRWQVENEVLFPFGVCPNMLTFDALKREVDLVRSLDDAHPIVVTDSGEWSPWMQFVGVGDAIGASMYRGAWNDHLGFIPFPVGPGWYQLRARLLAFFNTDVFTSELQAEPWGKKSIQEMSVAEGLSLFPPEKLRENVEFAKRVGFPSVYLWGSEWWYWLLQHGDDRIWMQMKETFNPSTL